MNVIKNTLRHDVSVPSVKCMLVPCGPQLFLNKASFNAVKVGSKR